MTGILPICPRSADVPPLAALSCACAAIRWGVQTKKTDWLVGKRTSSRGKRCVIGALEANARLRPFMHGFFRAASWSLTAFCQSHNGLPPLAGDRLAARDVRLPLLHRPAGQAGVGHAGQPVARRGVRAAGRFSLAFPRRPVGRTRALGSIPSTDRRSACRMTISTSQMIAR